MTESGSEDESAGESSDDSTWCNSSSSEDAFNSSGAAGEFGNGSGSAGEVDNASGGAGSSEDAGNGSGNEHITEQSRQVYLLQRRLREMKGDIENGIIVSEYDFDSPEELLKGRNPLAG